MNHTMLKVSKFQKAGFLQSMNTRNPYLTIRMCALKNQNIVSSTKEAKYTDRPNEKQVNKHNGNYTHLVNYTTS